VEHIEEFIDQFPKILVVFVDEAEVLTCFNLLVNLSWD
jgi:hypothetical protein